MALIAALAAGVLMAHPLPSASPIKFANLKNHLMDRFSSFALASLFAFAGAQAQTSDIVVFSEMGEKFTLVIDGDVKNETPATRVVATGIRNETPLIVVRVAETGVPPVKQNAWMEYGKEYTIKLTTNKKGEYVLRMQGQAELGTAKATDVERPKPADFQEDGTTQPATSGQQSGGSQSSTTTTQTTGTSENVNMNFGVNGMGVNMTMGFTEPGTGSSTTTTTTTTTHTTTTVTDTEVDEPVSAPVSEPAYRMPGYSGPIGCAMPMSDGEFNEAKASIESKGFEESKMTLARQIGDGHCFSTAQVKGIMGLFGFEETKLEFAKYAYDHTHDIGNYYKVNDAFSFESSIEELNRHIKGR